MKYLLLLLLCFIVLGCKNNDRKATESTDAVYEPSNSTQKSSFLNIDYAEIAKPYMDSIAVMSQDSLNSDASKIYTIPQNKEDYFFNLDLSYSGPQVVHLSSDVSMIKFMIVCTVKGEAVENGYRLDSFDLAFRSINNNNFTSTFFTVSGTPTITEFAGEDYTYILNASIDFKTTRNFRRMSTSQINIPNNIIRKGSTMEITIDGSKVIDKLKSDKGNYDKILKDNDLSDLEDICCFGAICQLRLLF